MKIGIVSMQRIINYGSFLQAYYLKKLLEELGHEVFFVDFKIEKPILITKKQYIQYYRKKIINACIRFFESKKILYRLFPKSIQHVLTTNYNFRKFYWKQLGLTKTYNYKNNVDVIIIGSDEVFNCTQLNPLVGFSKNLFGYGFNSAKIISFAASFGNTTIEKIDKIGIRDDLALYLSKFNYLSVRDENSYNIIKDLIDCEISVNPDPVVISTLESFENKDIIKNSYILIYAYRNRLKNEEVDLIINFAKNNNKKIYSISGYYDFCDKNLIVSPFEIISYFSNAFFVFTDTFHGTIFSLKAHSKFGVFVRESISNSYGNSEKLKDLLMRFDLCERIIDIDHNINLLYEKKIDFDSIDTLCENSLLDSKNYLIKAIGAENED
ncbi:MAG: polysaccharide pyruvyl transferase family protein [Sphaerochaetaceae bacterium]|nr:polysaccharide pyruvyl transferase family protein [Sphaerochaetaceae bacterium]